MAEQILYKDLAKYYDRIYSWKNYKEESKKIISIVQMYKKSKGNSLLDVACGTGQHIRFLEDEFCCVGVDKSEHMLTIAKSNTKKSTFYLGNMETFHLENKYDVILCLFSSIAYLKTYEDLEKTINNFANHLKKGGILIIDPWFSKLNFVPRRLPVVTSESENSAITRVGVNKKKNGMSIMEMHFLLVEEDLSVKYYKDIHEFSLFEEKDIFKIINQTGLQAKSLDEEFIKGRKLILATSPVV